MSKYKGELIGFPKRVVEWMLDNQEAQGNKRDVRVFEEDSAVGAEYGGFRWDDTQEGFDFCDDVINNENFSRLINLKGSTRNVTFRVRKQHAEAFKQLVRDRVYPELKAMYANDSAQKKPRV